MRGGGPWRRCCTRSRAMPPGPPRWPWGRRRPAGCSGKRPALVHSLWLLVLLKLVTRPALVHIPASSGSRAGDGRIVRPPRAVEIAGAAGEAWGPSRGWRGRADVLGVRGEARRRRAVVVAVAGGGGRVLGRGCGGGVGGRSVAGVAVPRGSSGRLGWLPRRAEGSRKPAGWRHAWAWAGRPWPSGWCRRGSRRCSGRPPGRRG